MKSRTAAEIRIERTDAGAVARHLQLDRQPRCRSRRALRRAARLRLRAIDRRGNKLDQAGRKSRAAEDALKGALNALDEIVADINEAIARQSPVDPTSDRLFPRTEEKDERRAADNQRRRHQTGWEKGKGRMPWHARTGD